MAEHCTIFCPHVAYAQVTHYLEQNANGSFQIVGETEDWQTITVSHTRSTLKFTSLKYEQGGDKFSHLILSTHNFFRNVPASGANKQRALQALLSCEWIIGVVANESFDEDENTALVFAITQLLDAMIFNGSGMLDKDGNLILDSQGNSEIGP